jgi:hypothetical protein
LEKDIRLMADSTIHLVGTSSGTGSAGGADGTDGTDGVSPLAAMMQRIRSAYRDAIRDALEVSDGVAARYAPPRVPERQRSAIAMDAPQYRKSSLVRSALDSIFEITAPLRGTPPIC